MPLVDSVRTALALPRPVGFAIAPTPPTQDLAPQPVDRLITAMSRGTGPVTREEALSVAAVQRGRNELCSIATIPLRLWKDQEPIDSPLFRQHDLNVPNVVHVSITIEDLALCAVAWWEVLGRDFAGYPAAVTRIDPADVSLSNPAGSPRPGDERYVWIRVPAESGGGYRQVPAADMIRFDSPNPGILRANATVIRIARRLDTLTEMYATNPALREVFTDNLDHPEAPDRMSDDEVDAFLAEYGAQRQIRPYAWLPSTVSRADVASPSPADLTLVDLRREVGIAIANGLGIDPEDIGISTTSRTYFNATDRRQEKINRMYAPYMRAITHRLTMGDVTPRGYRVDFDTTEYLRADPASRIAYYQGLGPLVGGLDPAWIARQEGIPVQVIGADAAKTAPVQLPAARPGVAAFAAPRPTMTFAVADFAAAGAPAPTVDSGRRTITGLAVPYNVIGNKYGLKYRFRPGSLEYSSLERMPHLKDHMTPVGSHQAIKDTPEGPIVTLHVLDAPEGSRAKEERDLLLHDAQAGLYSGLSIGVEFSADPADGDVEIGEDGVYDVVRATWRETSTTYMPVFDDARVTAVAASAHGGTVMKCIHCGREHAPNIACATFAAHAHTTATPADTTATSPDATAAHAGAAGPLSVSGAQSGDMNMYAAALNALAGMQGRDRTAAGPTEVTPHRGLSAAVTEPAPYRFDRRGNLTTGSHDFSSDLYAGWKQGDQAARDRAEGFLRDVFSGGVQRFAVTPPNVAALNYPVNRPDLYVDQLDYQYPLTDAVLKGTLDAVTPFVIPKFATSSGLVADHVPGTEPTPGTFTATAQTITPSALSGKVEITREAFDQGGNPQMSGLIWTQMTRSWYEGLEDYVESSLAAASATIPDIVITTGAVDGVLDAAISAALVPLQYIRGGDRFSKVFTQIDLYKAMVAAKDADGRRLYPTLGAVNAAGTTDPRYNSIDAHGKLWVPSWATAASGTAAASSWTFNPSAVCLWASAPQRIDLQWRVAWVDIGIWGYKAFGITDMTQVREIVYDPAV